MKENTITRERYVDMVKGLGILMITYGHVTSLLTPVDIWFSLIKVPLFFVISGYTIALTGKWRERSIKEYSSKLSQSLLVPYVWFSLIYLMISLLTERLKGSHTIVQFIKEWFFNTVTFRGVTTLWFLPTMFLGELLFLVLLKTNKKWVLVVAAIASVAVGQWAQMITRPLQMEIDKSEFVSTMLPEYWFLRGPFVPMVKSVAAIVYFVLGYVAYGLIQRIRKNRWSICLGMALLLLTMVIAPYAGGINYNKLRFGSHLGILFVMGAFLGTVGAILIFSCLEQYFDLWIFEYHGKNSLLLMCSQRVFMLITIANKGFVGITTKLPKEVTLRYYCMTFAVLVIALTMNYAITEFVNKKAPFLLGKKRKTTK